MKRKAGPVPDEAPSSFKRTKPGEHEIAVFEQRLVPWVEKSSDEFISDITGSAEVKAMEEAVDITEQKGFDKLDQTLDPTGTYRANKGKRQKISHKTHPRLHWYGWEDF